jgi:anti-sigma B factor antagonist
MPLDAPLAFEFTNDPTSGTRIYTLTGPLTLRNIFELQAELRNGSCPAHSILDLSGVPYMDSAGMGLIINYYVHCQNCGAKMVVVGVSPRVLELFRMTRVDTVIPRAESIEAAQAAV